MTQKKQKHLQKLQVSHIELGSLPLRTSCTIQIHFAATRTFVIPVPTIGGYRNLLAKSGDSGTTGTSSGRISLRSSRNDTERLNSYK